MKVKKNMIIVLLFLCLLVIGGATAYFYLGFGETPDYSNGMFVDRGEVDNGYEAVYHLLTSV